MSSYVGSSPELVHVLQAAAPRTPLLKVSKAATFGGVSSF